MYITIFVIALLSQLVGCASTIKLDQETFHERNLKYQVQGIEYHGIGVLPPRKSHTFKIYAHGDHDLLVLRTCGREVRSQDKGSSYKYIYTPVDSVERSPLCKISIASIDNKGRHGWASAYLDDPRFKLKGELRCNGKQWGTSGVSACQAKRGLISEIVFNAPAVAASNKCGVVPGKMLLTHRFKMPNKECSVAFSTSDKRLHLMHLTGYHTTYMRD